MTDPQAIQLIEEFMEALKSQDFDRIASYFADDVQYQNVPFPIDRGKARVMKTLTSFSRIVTGFDYQMKNIAARNGVVLTERIDVLTGPLVHLDIWVCGTFEVRAGKIVLWRDYFDLASGVGQVLLGPVRALLRR
jgi:limonene-1,2-epoxide hydrolase